MRIPPRTLLVACLLLVVALIPALAATPWTVVPETSRLSFSGEQMGAPFEGQFKRYDAEIAFDPEDLAGSRVVVTIDMASAGTGNGDRDALLPGADWFDVANYPQARLETKGFRHLGGESYEAQTILTLRGTAKPVTLPFTLAIAGGTARVEGATTIRRGDFGVGQGQWANSAVVGQDVTVRVSLTAKRGR